MNEAGDRQIVENSEREGMIEKVVGRKMPVDNGAGKRRVNFTVE